jgi:hypothetical protein
MKGFKPSRNKDRAKVMREEMLRRQQVRRSFGVGQKDPEVLSRRQIQKRKRISEKRKAARVSA